MSCISSVDSNILWLLILLVNYVAMLLVVCQLSRDVIGYEDSISVIGVFRFISSVVTVKQSSIVSQIVSSPVVLS